MLSTTLFSPQRIILLHEKMQALKYVVFKIILYFYTQIY